MPEDIVQSASVGGSTDSAGGGSTAAVLDSPESSPAGASDQSGGDQTQTPQSIPYQRFKEVNDKLASLRWAESHDSNRVQQQQAFFHWLDTDPEGAFRYVEDYLTRNGAIKRQPQQAQAQDNGRPAPDVVVPETGQRFYSAEAFDKALAWERQQLEGSFDKRLQPLEQTMAVGRARADAQRQLAEAETWPHYKDHEADILRVMETDRRLSLEGAYTRVVVPKLRQLERDAVLKEIHDKRHASTVNPGSSTPTERAATSNMSWGDLFKRELAKRR